ncbi:MAG: hypothetical protein WC661_10200 [Opitutaceae bacterium]|jgi:hypothetical protein
MSLKKRKKGGGNFGQSGGQSTRSLYASLDPADPQQEARHQRIIDAKEEAFSEENLTRNQRELVELHRFVYPDSRVIKKCGEVFLWDDTITPPWFADLPETAQ